MTGRESSSPAADIVRDAADAAACDGAYVTLAEMLDAPLVTCEAKLARSHGNRARIELID